MFDLTGKKGLVVGIANSDSIAFGCAKAAKAGGAEIAVTWLNDRARAHVEPLADSLGAVLRMPLDVEQPGAVAEVFEAVRDRWGRLDFLVHSIAFAPAADLRGRVLDCTSAGFETAMRVSCYSLIEMAKHAEPLMTDGGAIVTMSFAGADRTVPSYGMMGPVKAALQSTVRYLAREMGPSGIRVIALSPGPIATRAASGLPDFDGLAGDAVAHSHLGRLVTIDEVGAAAAFLVSDGAAGMTGCTIPVDAGRHAAQ
ncbi:MAG: enoyl-ACP reductase FabI [Candidatus Binatia bacterium]